MVQFQVKILRVTVYLVLKKKVKKKVVKEIVIQYVKTVIHLMKIVFVKKMKAKLEKLEVQVIVPQKKV